LICSSRSASSSFGFARKAFSAPQEEPLFPVFDFSDGQPVLPGSLLCAGISSNDAEYQCGLSPDGMTASKRWELGKEKGAMKSSDNNRGQEELCCRTRRSINFNTLSLTPEKGYICIVLELKGNVLKIA
jgi:hypothetical protein